MNEYSSNFNNGKMMDSPQQPADPLPRYTIDVEQAANIFSANGFRVATRTLTSHCRSNLLDCEKFINGNVTKWKITKESIDNRIEALRREGGLSASSNRLQPAGPIAGNSEQQAADRDSSFKELVDTLKDELKEKNKQISEYQSIIHTQNKQFGNLNETIQLSNQTIQQLNKTLALPQIKDYVKSTQEKEVPSYQYDVPKTYSSDDREHKPNESTNYSDEQNKHQLMDDKELFNDD